MGSSNYCLILVHITSTGVKITTTSLNIRANYDSHLDIFNGLLASLAKGQSDPLLSSSSSTGEFKLIPFANYAFSKDQIAALIHKQNELMHRIKAILVINLGSLDGVVMNEDKRAIK